jgi:hypothetical protein
MEFIDRLPVKEGMEGVWGVMMGIPRFSKGMILCRYRDNRGIRIILMMMDVSGNF